MPMALRLAAPAPEAMTMGNTPMMKEMAVIITARKRCRAPSRAASWMGTPRSRSILENSTIRMAFFPARPTSITRPS